MGDHKTIGVRYCGGCNARYDRVALVKRLEALCPGVALLPAEPGVRYAAVLVVCGCPSRCAKVDGLTVPVGGLVYLGGWEDLLPAKKSLEDALCARPVRALTHEEVLAILPHRPPMLFIDTVSRLIPGEEAVASFLARADLPAFAGHFPGEPVLPGIYTVEAAAQTADLLILTTDRYAGRTPLFMGIRRANFRKKILPGDLLEIHATLLEERQELGAVTCRGQVFTAGALCADMELRLSMR